MPRRGALLVASCACGILFAAPGVRCQDLDPADLAYESALQAAKKDYAAARGQIEALIDGPLFERLDARKQHAALGLAGAAALRTGDARRAHDLAVRTTSDTVTILPDWVLRLSSAQALHDMDDALRSLTVISTKWPNELTSMSRGIAIMLHDAQRWEVTPRVRIDALQALFDAKWRTQYGVEPSEVWRDFAVLLLANGELDRARTVSRRVTSAVTLISMRADRRFDPVVIAEPVRFDVDAALAAEVASLRSAVGASPDLIGPILRLADALLTGMRCEEALEILDTTRARAASLTAETHPFADGGEEFVWLLDTRARALNCLGRWDEALRQRIQASVLQERGNTNVSHAINLAGYYTLLGKPKEALETIAKVGRPSEYGGMQIQSVRLSAALELGDSRAAEQALGYMSEHQDDALATFQGALVRSGRIDDAAQLLIRRLESSELRSDALVEVQSYASSRDTPVTPPWKGNTARLLGRPDVRAAIERVGRIETYGSIAQQ